MVRGDPTLGAASPTHVSCRIQPSSPIIVAETTSVRILFRNAPVQMTLIAHGLPGKAANGRITLPVGMTRTARRDTRAPRSPPCSRVEHAPHAGCQVAGPGYRCPVWKINVPDGPVRGQGPPLSPTRTSIRPARQRPAGSVRTVRAWGHDAVNRPRTLSTMRSTKGSRSSSARGHSVEPPLNTSPLPRVKVAIMPAPRPSFSRQ